MQLSSFLDFTTCGTIPSNVHVGLMELRQVGVCLPSCSTPEDKVHSNRKLPEAQKMQLAEVGFESGSIRLPSHHAAFWKKPSTGKGLTYPRGPSA